MCSMDNSPTAGMSRLDVDQPVPHGLHEEGKAPNKAARQTKEAP